ncbi:MAG: efflux RND transporter periplasmic adaptor subunit [Hyphomicrobiaceae bacterium]
MTYDWKKISVVGSGVAVALAGIWLLLREPPIPVDLHIMKRQPLVVTIDEEGVSKIRDVYKVSAPIAGRVLRSPLYVGDPVIRGKTVVATIEPVSPSLLDERSRETTKARLHAAKSAVELARANVVRSKADLAFKEKEFWRAQRLVRKQNISQRKHDEARMSKDMAAAALNTAKAELGVRERERDSVQAELIEPTLEHSSSTDTCCVQKYAPVSGRVIRIVTESEAVVASGTPLVEIGDPRKQEIVVDLLSSDAVRAREGASAEIVAWGSSTKLRAVVKRIEPAGFTKISALGIEEQRVKARLRIDEPYQAWSRLGHDYRVYVRIIEWQSDDVLTVPLGALFRRGNSWAVFVEKNGKVEQRTVMIGHKNDVDAEITNNLKPGDAVVLYPNDRVVDGSRVVDRSTLR